jgi:hypothetical protein
MSKTEGYKGHRPGTRKGTVHRVFDEKGAEAALKKALSLDLAKGTVYSWFSEWRNPPASKAKGKSAKGSKNTARRAKGSKNTARAKVTKRAKVAPKATPRAKVSKKAAKRATIETPGDATAAA